MSVETRMNRRVVLNSRPSGAPTRDNFRIEEQPVTEPAQGEVLLRTVYLSLDPYMRGRMNEGPSYAPPVELGEVMVGGTVSRVEASRHPDFQPGDLVLGYSGWQEYEVCDGSGLNKLPAQFPHPSYALGVLGMPGFTAYVGLLDIGAPKGGETLVVAAATGAVGSAVGQIAKLKGCRTVGIAGGEEKCRIAVEEFGFERCLDHHRADLAAQLKEACPKGIDIYYENVGGKVFQAVWPLLNQHARVPVCGLIAHYNQFGPGEGPDRLPLLMGAVLARRIRVQGFIISDHYETRLADFTREMGQWVRDGQVQAREQLIEGLDQAPQGLIDLLAGKNLGKVVVRVSPQ
ncbi:NADP-dependent oxidoreductase [Geomonas silvestris]|uniref:NADP-dependent oxidoreductase n=1 Tax=Geomonas silvestris TaxID=2740184 RepID=A0A6V8MJQ5_9BACT|nr:NADP-dependent oxidoreductase [Geomonas silvestris]GFO60192.1 NADP-dependent oxidoreductase [Geomonas silvestris]